MVLKGKRILITGGGRGIGKAVAAACLKEGARVALVARSKEELKATQSEFKKEYDGVEIFAADVSDPQQAARLAEYAVQTLGGIDVLVNAAGVYGPIGLSTAVDLGKWIETFAVNLFGAFHMFRAVAPVMMKQGKGKIVNFSGGGDGPLPNFSAYSASKAAVVRLTETLAAEMREYHVDMNAIAPGAVNTKLLEDSLSAGEALVGKKKYADLLKQKQEGGVSSEKAAQLCVFLASDASDGLTGKLLSAVWDDYRTWDKDKIEAIAKSDLYTLRRVNPQT